MTLCLEGKTIISRAQAACQPVRPSEPLRKPHTSSTDWKPVSRARFGDILGKEVAELPPDAPCFESKFKAAVCGYDHLANVSRLSQLSVIVIGGTSSGIQHTTQVTVRSSSK
jgi:hypothetical protein